MDCIVLGRKDFREFDQIISVFSKENGKIDLLAKGVKKIKSKNSAFLEPFSFIDAEVLPGKEFLYVGSVYQKNFFKNIRTNRAKSVLACFLVDFLNDFLKEGEKDFKIYGLLKKWFTVLDEYNKKIENGYIFADAFMIKFFSLLGFMPQLCECIHCQKKYNKNSVWNFAFLESGIICDLCSQNGGKMLTLTDKQRNDLVFLLKKSFSETIDGEHCSAHKLIFNFVLNTTEKKVCDWVCCG